MEDTMIKNSLIALTLLFAVPAFSCPQLDGVYRCQSNHRVDTKEIYPTQNGFEVITNGNYVEYITDNQYYEIDPTDSYEDAFHKSRCQNDKLIVEFKANILYQGSVVARQRSTTEYQMVGDQLHIERKTRMRRIPMPTVRSVCERI